MNKKEYDERMKNSNYKALRVTSAKKEKAYVFISYRSDSWKTVLTDIVYTLQRQYGLRVYFDKDFQSNNNIWIDQFRDNMDSEYCKAVLCFWDGGYVSSYATALELMFAQNRNKKVVEIVNREVSDFEPKNFHSQDDTGLGVLSKDSPAFDVEYKTFVREFQIKAEKNSSLKKYFDVDRADRKFQKGERLILDKLHTSQIMQSLRCENGNSRMYNLDEQGKVSKEFYEQVLLTSLWNIDQESVDQGSMFEYPDIIRKGIETSIWDSIPSSSSSPSVPDTTSHSSAAPVSARQSGDTAATDTHTPSASSHADMSAADSRSSSQPTCAGEEAVVAGKADSRPFPTPTHGEEEVPVAAHVDYSHDEGAESEPAGNGNEDFATSASVCEELPLREVIRLDPKKFCKFSKKNFATTGGYESVSLLAKEPCGEYGISNAQSVNELCKAFVAKAVANRGEEFLDAVYKAERDKACPVISRAKDVLPEQERAGKYDSIDGFTEWRMNLKYNEVTKARKLMLFIDSMGFQQEKFSMQIRWKGGSGEIPASVNKGDGGKPSRIRQGRNASNSDRKGIYS